MAQLTEQDRPSNARRKPRVPVAAEDAPVLLVTTEDAALETHARRQAARPVVLDSSSQALRDLRLRESNYRRLLGLADALTAALAVLVAVDGVGARPLRLLYLLVVPLMILAAKLGGLYDNDELVLDRTTLKELPRLVNVASVVALLIWLMRHYLVTGTSDTFHLLMLWGLLIGGLVVTRAVARRVAERISPVERCMLVGGAGVFERLAGKLEHLSGVDLVGRTDPEIAMDHRALHELLVREQVHRLIIETGVAGPAATLDIIRMANMTGLRVSLLPTTLGAVGSSVVFDDIGGLVLMGVPHFGLSRSSLALKRSFDLIGATIATVLLAPVMAVIALAVKLDSRGPVLFRQTRMGRDETVFKMLKFRSMLDGADTLKDSLREHNEAACASLFKIDADPRLTRVGKLIRRYGLDELPQLFNVLAGSMSLVGPRPLVIDEDSHVTGLDRGRLHLTPGITGRWQTLGSARIPLSEMVKIDYLYIANWSPWTDLRIIVDTIAYLASGDGQ
jgi:exopolysaccharide biosynthesis polyprenyl glycosylphosphotransferase